LNKPYIDVDNIFTVSDTAIFEHLMTGLITIGFFMLLFAINYALIYIVIRPKFARGHSTSKERITSIVNLNANFHHLIIGGCTIYTIFAMCDRPFGMFKGDEMCLRTYKPFYSHSVIFTASYFLYDMIMQIFVLKDWSPLGK